MGRRRVHGSGGGRDGRRFQPFEHPSFYSPIEAGADEHFPNPQSRISAARRHPHHR
jgi:hypothetical protein